jgi:undecaprenyl-diphosphatase
LLGIDRSEASRFSFLMVLVPILGAGLLEAKDVLEEPSSSPISLEALGLGFAAALGAGLLACRSMVTLMRRRNLMPFAYYLVGLGVLSLVLALRG